MAPIYPPTSEPTSSVSSPVTASIVPPIPVPTHGPGGSFSVLAKTRVAVPPLQALHLIQDTNSWKEWNSFCPHCVIEKGKGKLDGERVEGRREEEGWLESGSVATIDVYLNGDGLLEGRKRSRTQGVVITRVEDFDEECGEGQEGRDGRRKGYRIAWKSTGWAHWVCFSSPLFDITRYPPAIVLFFFFL